MGVHHGVGVDLDAEAGVEWGQECEEVGAIEGGADEEPARRPAVEDVVPTAGWVEARRTGHGGARVELERYTWHQTCRQDTWHRLGAQRRLDLERRLVRSPP